MKKMLIEVLGTEPPCARCNLVHKTIEKIVHQLERDDIEVTVEKRNCADNKVISRYGIIIPPAVAVNNIVLISGRTPNESEIRKLIMENAEGDQN
ncbi:thioredoxin family protein [[Eubacterium] cellulosolvens]